MNVTRQLEAHPRRTHGNTRHGSQEALEMLRSVVKDLEGVFLALLVIRRSGRQACGQRIPGYRVYP